MVERDKGEKSGSLAAAGGPAAARREILALLLPPLVHRLNNSLAVVHGTLEAACTLPEESRLEAAASEVRRMNRTLMQLSILGRDYAPSVASFDPTTLLGTAATLLRPLAESRGIELVQRSAVSRGVVLRADERRLQQLWVCQVADAILALSGEGGARPETQLSMALVTEGRRVSLTLGYDLRGDSPSADFSRLERWRDALPPDLGIGGLHMQLGASSGSLRLDFRPAVVAGLGEEQASRSPGGQAGSVLLIEPFREIGELIREVLEEQGLDTSLTHEVEKVRELLDSEDWDLVLFDTEMELLDPGLLEMLQGSHWAAEGRLGILDDGRQDLDLADCSVLEKPLRPLRLLDFVGERLSAHRS